MNGYEYRLVRGGLKTQHGSWLDIDQDEVGLLGPDRRLVCICRNVPELIKMAIDIHQKGEEI